MSKPLSLEIKEVPDHGQVELRLTTATGSPGSSSPTTFTLDLTDDERAALDWYHTEFQRAPIGVLSRAEAIEEATRNLGRVLFETLFSAGSEGRSLLDQFLAEDGEAEVVIVSPNPRFLALPWELMNDPTLGYFCTRVHGVVRQFESDPPVDDTDERTEESFNVFVLSPTPIAGSAESHESLLAAAVVAGGNLADATVAALESLNLEASLNNPRPATLEALSRYLGANPGAYHVAHLDGVTANSDGMLLLESDDGSPDPVQPEVLGRVLADSGVKVCLISAGAQASGSTTQLWSTIAASVARAGVAQVAMIPFPLHPDTREAATREFYAALAQGNSVAHAVARLRTRLMDAPERVTLNGKRVTWDWHPPIVYQSRRYLPPTIAEHQPDPLAPPVIHPEEAPTEDLQIPAAGQYGLVGRHAELRQLEHLLRANAVVMLSGDTGVGKTELALGLCRWFLKPARVTFPGGVFYTAFEASHPAGIERVVHEIGTAVAGLDFANIPANQQRQWVTTYLQQNASLLVWDNVENVAGFPDGSPGLLDETELPGLAAFLSEVTTGPVGSRGLLLSRRPSESWLSVPHTSVRLDGLMEADRNGLAAAVMEKVAVPASRVGNDFGELMELLQGHPLAMQVAIPPVKEVPASVAVGEITRLLNEMPDGGEPGRAPILTAAMEYAFSRMSHRSRTHLPFLSMFQRRVMLDVLNHITQERVYATITGEDLGWGACRTLLRSAMSSGFVEPISPSVYQINPAMPWFLGQKLGRLIPAGGIQQLETEFVRVYADTADYFMESLYENQDTGVTAVLAEEGNLTQALGLSLEYRQWDNAQLLIQPLAQVYRMQRRFPELRRLRGQLLDTVGHSAAEAEANGAIEFWQYILGTDAMESVELLELDRASGYNDQLLAYLLSQDDGETDPRTAAVYHQNGLIASRRGQYDAASEWLEKGLEIIDGGEDQESIADACFAIGQVRHHQRQYGSAKEWYSRALDIHQRLPDYEEMVSDYRALGAACHLRFEYDEARSWYHRAREIVEENRDEETAVYIFHALGTVDHSEYLFEEAQNWYQQALGLCDRLGMQEQMVIEFHHLGTLAQARGIPDEAEEWLATAMDTREEMGDVRGMGIEARQIGVLHHEQGNLDQAQEWYDRARQAFEDTRDILRAARTYGQMGMVEEQRGNLTGAMHWVSRTYQLVVDHQLPMLVQVKAHLGRLEQNMGAEAFSEWWRGNVGSEPPEDLQVDTSTIL